MKFITCCRRWWWVDVIYQQVVQVILLDSRHSVTKHESNPTTRVGKLSTRKLLAYEAISTSPCINPGEILLTLSTHANLKSKHNQFATVIRNEQITDVDTSIEWRLSLPIHLLYGRLHREQQLKPSYGCWMAYTIAPSCGMPIVWSTEWNQVCVLSVPTQGWIMNFSNENSSTNAVPLTCTDLDCTSSQQETVTTIGSRYRHWHS